MNTPDSDVRCTVCGRTERVNFGECLALGWPKCHDLTMHLDHTDADIDASVGRVIRRSFEEA